MAEETKNTAPDQTEGSTPKTYSEEEYTALQSRLTDAQKQLEEAGAKATIK